MQPAQCTNDAAACNTLHLYVWVPAPLYTLSHVILQTLPANAVRKIANVQTGGLGLGSRLALGRSLLCSDTEKTDQKPSDGLR